ncbi:MAG: glycosyltransferase family 4 protein [Candidatus Limivicinus sp.]|jgi:teichuronic acid biosynthesis glycosyltransferase TuaC
MNILVVAAHGLYEDYAASFVHNQLKSYVKAGHRVRAVVPVALGKKTDEFERISAPIVRTEHDGVEILYLRCLSLGSRGENSFNPWAAELALRLQACRILEDFKPDIIHAHGILFGGRLGAVLKKSCKVPLVITTHGGDTRLAVEEKFRERAAKICSAASAVAAVSDACRRLVESLNSCSRTLCILNGFNFENLRSLPKKRHSIAQVCVLRPDKHTELSIMAVSKLRGKYPDIRLTIVGDGEERNKLEKLVREKKLEDIISFKGWLPNDKAMEEMAESEFFLMPSIREGFGIVYLEAMASGCVTIGTENEGIASLIRHGENGFLAAPMDVEGIVNIIEYCFENPEEARHIADAGRTSALSLTWEKNAAEYTELFNDVLSNNK